MAKRVIVTGASGFLGRSLSNSFADDGWEVVGTGLTRAHSPAIRKVDLLDHGAVLNLLDQEKPTVVVHAAANKYPDLCDADPESARSINVDATRFLAQATVVRHILLVYISTDYVFAGEKGEAPYEAGARTGPTNLYGQTKLDGERAIIEEADGLGVILRVPVLYGPAFRNKESAINVLVDMVWKAQGKETKIKVDDWSQRFPTHTEDVSRVCRDVANKYLSRDPSSLPRILQFSSSDRFTKYEICQLLAEILGLPLDGILANREGNDRNSETQRPFDTQLSTRALEEIGVPVWTQDFKAWWYAKIRSTTLKTFLALILGVGVAS